MVGIFRDSSHLLASDHGRLPFFDRPRECFKKSRLLGVSRASGARQALGASAPRRRASRPAGDDPSQHYEAADAASF